jgi:pimeloyl-ACP methyl ester carboxylesterase
LSAAFFSLTHQEQWSRTSLRALRYALVLELLFLITAAIWGLAYEKSSSARERRLHPAPGKLVDVGGYRLHLYCTGAGAPTVVLDHGLSASYVAWHFVQPGVAKFTRVCSFDRAGNGWSERSPEPRLPKIMAEELNTLLLRGGEKPAFVMVGHSAGALDVIAYARQYPNQVAGLVLVDGSHPNEFEPFTWKNKIAIRWLQWTAPFGLPRWRRWCEDGVGELRELKRGFSCDSRIFKTQYDEWSALAERNSKSHTTLEPLGDFPLVVISRDPNINSANAGEKAWARLQQDLLNLSSNASHVIATGSGHAVNIERPDLVIEAVRGIVDQVRRTSAPVTSPKRDGTQ